MKHSAPPSLWFVNLAIFVYQSTSIIFATAIPNLASDLKLSSQATQLMSSIYFAGFTLGILIFGRSADLYGRKTCMSVGISIYTVASLAMALSSDIRMLKVLQFMQATGVSVCSIVIQSLSRDAFAGRELNKFYSYTGVLVCLIPVIATSLAEFLLHSFGSWRACMLFMSCNGAFLLAVCLIYLKETLPEHVMLTAQNTKFSKIFFLFICDYKALRYAAIAGLSIAATTNFFIQSPSLLAKYFQITPQQHIAFNSIISIFLLIANFSNVYIVSRRYNVKRIIITLLGINLLFCAALLYASYLYDIKALPAYLLAAAFGAARIMQGIVHTITMPYVLSIALEKYRGFFGSATSLFNSSYNLIVSITCFIAIKVHSDQSVFLFGGLMLLLVSSNFILSFPTYYPRHSTPKNPLT